MLMMQFHTTFYISNNTLTKCKRLQPFSKQIITTIVSHLNFIHNIINYMKDVVNLIDLINGCGLSLTSISPTWNHARRAGVTPTSNLTSQTLYQTESGVGVGLK